MRERKRMDTDGKGGGKKPGWDKPVISIYFMKKYSIFLSGKTFGLLLVNVSNFFGWAVWLIVDEGNANMMSWVLCLGSKPWQKGI